MFTVLAAAAGVGACAEAIGKHFCKVSNPVLQEFWEAALQGNSAVVERLIKLHGIRPDTRHHVSDASLVIEITDHKAGSEALDWGLAGVLRTLAQAGWSLTVRRRVTNENGLHLLACQPQHHHIGHRLRVLLDMELAQPRRDSMLAQRDWVDHLPEQKAPARGDARRLRHQLAAARHAVTQSVKKRAQQQSKPWNPQDAPRQPRQSNEGSEGEALHHCMRRASVGDSATAQVQAWASGPSTQVQVTASASTVQGGMTLQQWL